MVMPTLTNGKKPPFEPGSVQGRAMRSPEAMGGNVLPVSFIFNWGAIDDEIPEWSIYPTARDIVLTRLWKEETIMAGTVYSFTSRMKALEGDFAGGGTRRRKEYRNLLDGAEFGEGFAITTEKWVTDYLTTDNGGFIELWGPGDPTGPLLEVKGIGHLDSRRCLRTYDPVYPVFYSNPEDGKWRALHWSRVWSRSNMPQPIEDARGVGYCPVGRAIRSMRIMRDIAIYKDEKIGGRFTRGIIYGKGMTNTQLDMVLNATGEMADAEGLVMYKGMPAFITVDGVELDVLDLASIPDGFDTEKDTTLYVYALANAFGIDAREIWPATAAGATKADATVQHMKAKGKGIADAISDLEWFINNRVLPEGMEWRYDFKDDESDANAALLNERRSRIIANLANAKVIDREMAFTMAIAMGLIDPEKIQQVQEEILPNMDTSWLEEPDPAEMQQQQPDPNGQTGSPNQAGAGGEDAQVEE